MERQAADGGVERLVDLLNPAGRKREIARKEREKEREIGRKEREIARKERENFWGESEISLDQERSWTILAAVAKRSVFGSADGFQPTEQGALHGAGDKADWLASGGSRRK